MNFKKRKKIYEINKRLDLSQKDKCIIISKIMTKNLNLPKIKECKVSCNHYNNSVSIFTECCQKVYSCKICHDNSSNHLLKPEDVKKIICNNCNTKQDVNNNCIKCFEKYGTYHCEKCKIWDNTNIDIFHCDKCNLCRIGDKSKYFHCDNCDICMSLCLKDNHKCTNLRKSKCPICQEIIFNSKKSVLVLECNHIIHKDCLQKYILSGNTLILTCGICKKSIFNTKEKTEYLDEILRNNVMPNKYMDWITEILCNDCLVKSKTKYHFMLHKCSNCTSYNTTVINVIKNK